MSLASASTSLNQTTTTSNGSSTGSSHLKSESSSALGAAVGPKPENYVQETVEASGMAVALYEWEAKRDDELNVKVGDVFKIKSKGHGWWVVQRDEEIGWIPASILSESSSEDGYFSAEGVAIFDFTKTGPNELSIKTGDKLVSFLFSFFILRVPIVFVLLAAAFCYIFLTWICILLFWKLYGKIENFPTTPALAVGDVRGTARMGSKLVRQSGLAIIDNYYPPLPPSFTFEGGTIKKKKSLKDTIPPTPHKHARLEYQGLSSLLLLLKLALREEGHFYTVIISKGIYTRQEIGGLDILGALSDVGLDPVTRNGTQKMIRHSKGINKRSYILVDPVQQSSD